MKIEGVITLAGNAGAREKVERFIQNTSDSLKTAIINDGKVLSETWQYIEMDLEKLKGELQDTHAVSPRSIEAYISLDVSLYPLIKDTEFGRSLEKTERCDGKTMDLEWLFEIHKTSETAGLHSIEENLPWFPRSTIEAVDELIRERYIQGDKKQDTVKASDVLEAEAAFKVMERNYHETVEKYIKENVDENSLDSVEKAIFELPESKIKLRLYDMAWRLKEGETEKKKDTQ